MEEVDPRWASLSGLSLIWNVMNKKKWVEWQDVIHSKNAASLDGQTLLEAALSETDKWTVSFLFKENTRLTHFTGSFFYCMDS